MEMLHWSKLAKILMLAFFLTLLLLTPFISPSMRPSYLYFLLNLLIIALGAEAGFLSAISRPRDDKKLPSSAVASPACNAEITTSGTPLSPAITSAIDTVPMALEEEKKRTFAGVSSGLKRCKSRPSLFFIASCEAEEEEEEEVMEVMMKKKKERVMEEVGELSKQELFMKAEMFIGNFYKQLKMQRENSWQRLQGIYHKAF